MKKIHIPIDINVCDVSAYVSATMPAMSMVRDRTLPFDSTPESTYPRVWLWYK